MSSEILLTAEQFVAGRHELADGGRWTELIAGRTVLLSPPTVEHGSAVLTLSKALAEYSQAEQGGYACFELGLMVARDPDTVHFPPACFFTSGPMFAESDKILTETRPALVIELASSNDRRRGLEERVRGWLRWGVRGVWVLDPHAKKVHVFESDRSSQILGEHQSLSGGSILSGFTTSVGHLFKEPGWWKT